MPTVKTEAPPRTPQVQVPSDLAERVMRRVHAVKGGVSKFRDGMQSLGLMQLNIYVPQDGKEEVTLLGEKLRAYYFLKMCELPVTDTRRQLVADRNFFAMPSYERMKEIEDAVTESKLPLLGDVKAMKQHVGQAMSARGALQHTTESEEVYKFASLAVAHSAVAKYHHDYIMWSLARG
jgi:hypothetical protein